MKTTLQELLDGISSLDWSVNIYGSIRCANGRCPILAAVNEIAHEEWMDQMGGLSDNGDYNFAADIIGLTVNYQDFVAAVDNDEVQIEHVYKDNRQKRGNILRTRRRVMKALGLTERRSMRGILTV